MKNLNIDRNEFAKLLQKEGIGISVHFIPMFYFTYWKNRYPNFTENNFPEAAHRYKTTITIPLWPDMTDEMVQMVINAVKKIGTEHHV